MVVERQLPNATTILPDTDQPTRGDVQQTQVTSYPDLRPAYWPSLEKIVQLAELPPGWDSFGGPPLQQQAIESALFVLKLAERIGLPAPHLGPVSGGGIQLEWRVQSAWLEMYAWPHGKVETLRGQEGCPGDEEQEMEYSSILDAGVLRDLRSFVVNDPLAFR